MGINLNLHYCHGEVDSISFFVEDGSCICDEAFPDRMDKMTCCFDKNYKYEVDSEQIISPIHNFEFKVFGEKIIRYLNPLTNNILSKVDVVHSNSPPLFTFSKTPIRILFSIFRL